MHISSVTQHSFRQSPDHIPLNPRRLLIQVLQEKEIPLYSLVNEQQKNQIRKAVQEKMRKKIDSYQGCARAILRLWYRLHADVVHRELDVQNTFLRDIPYKIGQPPLFFDESHRKDRARRLILAAQNGRTELALALIRVMPAEELAPKEVKGETALSWAAYHGFNEIAFALIPKMYSEQLAMQEDDGKTPLYWAICRGHQKIAWALIPRLSPQQLSIPEKTIGETPLSMAIKKVRTAIAVKLVHIIYEKENFPKYSQLLQAITNNQSKKALALLETLTIWTSYPQYRYLLKAKMLDAWLTKPKSPETTRLISEEEYPKRAKTLKKNAIKLFQDLEIGRGEKQIPPQSLGRYTKQAVHNALERVLQNICNKTAWLGTPPSHDSARIHTFYSEMLSNFESVVKELQNKKDEQQIFTCLFSIAQPDLEGRCASAYQSEILQIKNLLTNIENMTVVVRIESIIKNILISKIEKIVNNKFSSDSHDYAQMFYFLGLSSVPDPLSTLQVKTAFSLIKSNWDTGVLCQWILSIQRIPKDLIFDWFKDMASRRHAKKKLFGRARMFETKQIIALQHKLDAMPIDPSHKKPVVEWMTSPRGGTLSYLPESLSPIWLQKIKKAKIFIENVLDESLMRARLASVKPKRTGKTAEYIREMQHFNVFIDALLKRNRSHQELQKIFAPTKLSSKDLDQLSAIRNGFSKKMKAWSDANKISYIPSYSPLPSVCLQEEARIQYASSHFTEEGRLNQKGVKKIVEKVGVAKLS